MQDLRDEFEFEARQENRSRLLLSAAVPAVRGRVEQEGYSPANLSRSVSLQPANMSRSVSLQPPAPTCPGQSPCSPLPQHVQVSLPAAPFPNMSRSVSLRAGVAASL